MCRMGRLHAFNIPHPNPCWDRSIPQHLDFGIQVYALQCYLLILIMSRVCPYYMFNINHSALLMGRRTRGGGGLGPVLVCDPPPLILKDSGVGAVAPRRQIFCPMLS